MVIFDICRILVSIVLFSNSNNAYQLFSIGTQLELAGKVEEAIEHYEQARQIDPNSPEIYVSLANALYKIRKFDEGIRYATEALSISSDSAQLYLIIGTGYISKGDFKNGITFYENALAIEPENIEIYGAISILYESSGKLKNAIQILERIPENIKSSELFTRLGSLSGKLNNHEIAIKYYRKSYTMDTTNITALTGIGTGFDILAMQDSAVFYYERVRKKDTLNIWLGKRLIELYSDIDQYGKLISLAQELITHDYADVYTRRNLGFAFYKMGMVQDALNEFLIASQLDPQDTYSRFYVGRIYLEQGNYNRARKEITSAIKINPDFIELWIYLGFIAMDQKDFETAEYAFSEAAYRGGDVVQIYYLLGVIAEMQDSNADAYFYYHKSLTIDPQDLASLEALAQICERIGRKDEAFKNFEKVLELDTTNAVVLNYVGYTYAERNDSLEYALDLINRALAIEENNGYYIDSRGWVFYQMGRYEEALVDLLKANELVEDAVILEHLGDIYIKLNDLIRAKEIFERVLELDPDNKTIKKKLLELNGKSK